MLRGCIVRPAVLNYRTIGSLFIAVILAGCASIGPAGRAPESRAAGSACEEWIVAVDRVVTEVGVADAGATRVPGFPYLRVNRFIASFGQEALQDPRLLEAWAGAARAMDREGRAIELQNLPARKLAALAAGTTESALARTESCAAERMRVDFANPAARERAVANARVPDDYERWGRILGLYPVTRIPFAQGVEQWHREAVAAFLAHSRGERPAPGAVRYSPAPAEPLSGREIAALLPADAAGTLGQLAMSAGGLERLFAAFAPELEVETEGDFDRVGTVRLRGDARPEVDTARAVVYRRLSFTRFNGEILPQLVYTAWFPGRPGSSPLDVLAGNLDGLVFRVTLGRDGAPLVYDAIHPCGCYHMFFPAARLRRLPAPNSGDEWAFVPAVLPDVTSGQRVTLHVQARTHYLTGISVAPSGPSQTYALEDEDRLRSLPVPGGGRRSLYAPDGLVAGSERLERFLFWPMGVPSAGTMRQWGHHATAFLGIRHFDDPFLMQERFASAAP